MQPLRCVPDSGSGVLVDLRCPECGQWRQGSLTRAEAQALDRAQSAARQSLVEAHERLVRESMEALARCFREALDRDLVGADDFDPRRLRAAWTPAREPARTSMRPTRSG